MRRFWWVLVASWASVASAAEAPGSVLGLEPGTHRLCNDDLGVIVWGPESAPTLSVGKSDVWDRRLPAGENRILTSREMIDGAMKGDPAIVKGAPWYRAYNNYDFPCPKPVGQLILQLPFLGTGGSLSMQESPREIVLTAACGAKSLEVKLFVSAVRNLIVIQGTSHGLEPGDMALRVWRHRDTIVPGGEVHPTLGGGHSPTDFEQLGPPRAGQRDGLIWVAQDYPAEATFPNGFTAALVCSTGDVEADYDVVEGVAGLGTPMVAPQEGRISHGLAKRFTPINESPGAAATATPHSIPESFVFYATAVTTQDDPDPLVHATKVLAEAKAIGTDALRAEHLQQLGGYDAGTKGCIQTAGEAPQEFPWGGVPYKVRSQGYYGDVPQCSVDSTKFCYQDSGMWHADFHFNEVEATATCIRRQFDLLDSYLTVIQNLLPMAQTNAKQVYDCPGAMYPLVHYPLKADTVIHTHMTWEQSMEITALLAKPFWLRYQYTGDEAFLRERAWPVLREGARFYAAYLKKESDGLYHVVPTVSPEHHGLTPNLELNKDSQSGITLIRYHLRAASTAAERLGESLDEAKTWRDIAEHMPPYPTVETPNGVVFTDVAGAEPMEYNIPVPLSAVFWGDDISPDSPPEQLELARRTLAHINVWEPHRGYLINVRRRLGVPNATDPLDLENFVQSYSGTLHVFPAVPANYVGRFENFGAQGAFVVSGERESTGVKEVRIQSLAGNPCKLANPWPDARPVVTQTDAAEVPCTLTGNTVEFATQAGETYLVRPTP